MKVAVEAPKSNARAWNVFVGKLSEVNRANSREWLYGLWPKRSYIVLGMIPNPFVVYISQLVSQMQDIGL